jgi:hypothetical protein
MIEASISYVGYRNKRRLYSFLSTHSFISLIRCRSEQKSCEDFISKLEVTTQSLGSILFSYIHHNNM